MYFLSFFFLFVSLVAGEVDIQPLCDSISGIYNCDLSIRYPSGARVKTCRNKWFDFDPCKTKTGLPYPCGTWSNPFKICHTDICVPGTNERWIDIPCGIDILTDDFNICDKVRAAFGSIGNEVIEKTTAMCSCLPKALELMGQGALEMVESDSDISSAVVEVLGKFADLITCVTDNGFDVEDNKEGILVNGPLAPEEGWIVLQAAEIDLSTYIEFAEVLAPCLVASCQPELIQSFFTNYLEDSRESIVEGIKTVAAPWIEQFNFIESEIGNLTGLLGQTGEDIKAVREDVKTLREQLCKNTKTCAQNTVKEFLGEVSRSLSLGEEVAKFESQVSKMVQSVQEMASLVETFIEGLDAVSEETSFMDLISDGTITKLADIGKAIEIARSFPELIENVGESLPKVTTFVSNVQAIVPQLQQRATKILESNWLEKPDVARDASGNAEKLIQRIQTRFRGKILPLVDDLTGRATTIFTYLSALPFNGGKLSLEARVTSYQRWSEISFDVPCTRAKRASFTVAGGFTGYFDYPEFYSCPTGPYKLSWPNHHIPYLRFRFDGPSTEQLVGFAAPPQIDPTVAVSSVAAAATGSMPSPMAPMESLLPRGTASTMGHKSRHRVEYLKNGSFVGQFDIVPGEDVPL